MGLFKKDFTKLKGEKALRVVNKTTDQAVLAEAALISDDRGVRAAAIEKIDSPEKLVDISKNAADIYTKLYALLRFPRDERTQAVLTDTLIGLSDSESKAASQYVDRAMTRLSKKYLGRVLLNANAESIYASTHIQQINDPAVLDAFVRKHPTKLRHLITKDNNLFEKMDRDTLLYILHNSDISSGLRDVVCELLGHEPDGNNKCKCAICGYRDLHDFVNGICKRCGAKMSKRRTDLIGRSSKVKYGYQDITIITYSDGSERIDSDPAVITDYGTYHYEYDD